MRAILNSTSLITIKIITLIKVRINKLLFNIYSKFLIGLGGLGNFGNQGLGGMNSLGGLNLGGMNTGGFGGLGGIFLKN